MALITCKKCGGQVSDKAQYCVHCGEPLQPSKTTCPSCKAEIQGSAKYCSNCGYNLTQTEESPKSNNERSPADISSYKQQSTSKITIKARKKKQGPPAWAVAFLAILSTVVIGFLCYTIFVGSVRKEPLQQDTIIPQTPPTAITTPQSTANTIETVQSNKPNKPSASDSASTSQFYEISETEIAYNEACHVSDYEKQSNGSLRYRSKQFNDTMSIVIRKDECSYFTLNHFWVDDCALYNAWTRTAAALIKNWKDEQSYELEVIKATIGTIPNESRTSRLERLNHFCEILTPDIDEMKLLDILSSKGAIQQLKKNGTDIEYDIQDLKDASKRLEISERMLGYIIAYIGGTDSAMSVKATFEENKVHVSIHKIDIGSIPAPVQDANFPS